MFEEAKDKHLKEIILSTACRGVEWEIFLDSVEKSVNLRLTELQLKHLSELSPDEQAILIENEVMKV
jgi:hypothetical protein